MILCDRRDDLNFPIVNFSFICRNIPAAPEYGVYISQFIWYSRACLSFCTFSVGLCVVCSSSIYGFWIPFGIFKLFSYHSAMHNLSIVRGTTLYLRLYLYIPLSVYCSDSNAVYWTFLWILSGFCRNNHFFILYLLQGSYLYRMDDVAEMKY